MQRAPWKPAARGTNRFFFKNTYEIAILMQKTAFALVFGPLEGSKCNFQPRAGPVLPLPKTLRASRLRL